MRALATLLYSFLAFHVFPQQNYKPSIVILDPYDFKYDSVLSREIGEFTFLEKPSESRKSEFLKSRGDQKGNNSIMDLAEYEFRLNMNFPSYFTLGLTVMITYRIFGETDNALIIPSHEKSIHSPEDLKMIALKHKVEWVLSPVELYSYRKEGKKYSRTCIVLYNLSKNKIVKKMEYVGDSKNPGFELSCEPESLKCTLNNITGQVTHEVVIALLGSYQN